MMRHVCACACLLLVSAAAAAEPEPGSTGDSARAAARRYVEASDRYLHHSRLERGNTGYGLTVMAGTEVVRFEAEIVSVMTDWGPHQDVILARLSGKPGGVNLADTGLISGMSGSPVFIRDPRDGEEKMIGAVAYGWMAQEEPVCGIQPITQMLASARIPGELPEEEDAGKIAAGASRDREAYLAALLDPKKRDFARLACRRHAPAPAAGGAGPRLRPMTTPVTLAGVPPRVVADARAMLEPLGLMPLQGGGLGAVEREAAGAAELVPGGAIGVPLVMGDADLVAVGTVTDVIDGRVLAFGHAFRGDGASEFPMSTAYVHTVVSSMFGSFKLGSGVRPAGKLVRDEMAAIVGRVGPEADLVPMNVSVRWAETGREQTYEFQICRHKMLTIALSRMLVMATAWGWHDLPPEHTIHYEAEVRFAELGRYHVKNTSSNEDVFELVSDVSRPLAALLDSPLGEPARVESIDVSFEIEPVARRAQLLDLRLHGRTYRPGETITGDLVIRRFRERRSTLPVTFELPEDMPEGVYTLTAMDYLGALSVHQREMPHHFAPKTPEQLFDAVQRVVGTEASTLYLHVPLPEGGLAIEKRELPDLPPSKARVIAEARWADITVFARSLMQTDKKDFVVSGAAAADFVVRKRPAETRLHQAKDRPE